MSQSGGQDGSEGAGAIGPVGRGSSTRASEISTTPGAGAAAGVEGGSEIEAAAATEGAQAAGEVGGTQQVSQALAAGQIDAKQATAALIEQALAEHLPADADPALVAEVRADLEAALAGDPTLNSLLS